MIVDLGHAATDEKPKPDVELNRLVFAAQRCMRVVGTDRLPTEWDKLHGRIDVRLTQMGY